MPPYTTHPISYSSVEQMPNAKGSALFITDNRDGLHHHSRASQSKVGVRPVVRGYAEKTAQTVPERCFIIVQRQVVLCAAVICLAVSEHGAQRVLACPVICLDLLVIGRLGDGECGRIFYEKSLYVINCPSLT